MNIHVEVCHDELKEDYDGKLVLLDRINDSSPSLPFVYGPSHSGAIPSSSVRHNPILQYNETTNSSQTSNIFNQCMSHHNTFTLFSE